VALSGIAREDHRILSLSHEEVLETLPLADVGFLLRGDLVVNRVASPTKFAEYCICGVPVLVTRYVGDYSVVVEAEHLGLCLDDLRASAKLLSFLWEVRKQRDYFAERCHRYASRHLTWDSAGVQLRAAYERLHVQSCSA
jgi:glycosyltransferase involved in cell wall biosynthesis